MTSAQVATAPARPQRTRRRAWISYPGLTATVAWLGFVALHRWLSGRVWWWALPELLPPLAFVVIPVVLLAAAPLARPVWGRIAVVTLASMVVGWGASGVNLAALWHRAEPTPPDAITVFAWNTWYWDQRAAEGARQPPPGGTPPADVAGFYRHLRDQAADVHLLQEYIYFDDADMPIRVDDADRISQELPGYHVAAAGELVTLSRFPIIREQALDLRRWLPAEPDDLVPPDSDFPDYFTAKILRTDIRIGEDTISFYNAHVNTPVDPSLPAADPRRFSRDQHHLRRANFRALAADLEENSHPAILAGDFNTSPAMGMLRMLPDRLVDPTPALGSLYPTSWSDRSLPLWRVDWAFTTSEVAVHLYRLVRQARLSDHSGQLLVTSLK